MENPNEMASVGIAIPKTLIEDTIRAEIVRQLGKKEEFAAAVIKAALNEKSKDDRYRYGRDSDTPTVFQHAITDMIQTEAKRVFGEWLDAHRKEIAAALVKHLNESKAARLKKLAEDMASGISGYRVDVSLHLGER